VAENLLHRDPPLIAGSLSSGFYQGQANARFYDRLGRMLRLGARFKFQGDDVSIFAWVISKFIQGVRHTLGTHIEGLKRRSGGMPDTRNLSICRGIAWK
jgi:hypothetical protein